MARFSTIFLNLYLSLAVMLPASVREECVKLPELWEHYQLHRQTAPDLSLTAFLEMHYGDTSHHRQQHDHSQIPFKDAHHCLGLHWHFQLAPIAINGLWFSKSPVFLLPPRPTFAHNALAVVEQSFAFFHPPKFSVTSYQ